MLEQAGFRVLEAQDSAEALALLADQDEIGILVTDVRMPGTMDGLALVAQVRHDHPAIKSIGVGHASSAAEARNAGVRLDLSLSPITTAASCAQCAAPCWRF